MIRRRSRDLGWPGAIPMLLGMALLSIPSLARAQRSDACFTAPVEGQKLQKDGKLLDARERFAVCARNGCPPEIMQDCTRWSREVDEALPSVVMAVRDGQGRDLVDVRVSVDGQPAIEVSARAVPLDPGTHRFVFQRGGNADVEQRVLLREGEKNREIAATFGSQGTVVASSTPKPPAGPMTAESRPSERAILQPVPASGRPVPASAWITGGLGIAGLATFATFAGLGIFERASDGCAKGCTQSQSDSVDTKFHVADVSLAVGVVALAVATWIYLSASKPD